MALVLPLKIVTLLVWGRRAEQGGHTVDDPVL